MVNLRVGMESILDTAYRLPPTASSSLRLNTQIQDQMIMF